MENTMMYYAFVRNGHRHFDPQYLSVEMTTTKWIFPIPMANAVGTLDEHSNAIVSMTFSDYGSEPKCKVIAQNFSKMVYGQFDYRFSQNFSKETIAYSSNQCVVIANTENGKAFYARCGLSIDDYILGARFLDTQKNLFVIVKSIDEGGNGWNDYLHIAELNGRKLVDTSWAMNFGVTKHISSYPPLYNTWYVHDCKLFVYDHGQVLCTDGYQSVSHPFSETFNANATRFGTVKDLAIHPKLPFGVIIEESAPKTHDLVVLRWDIPDPKKKGKQVIAFGQTLEPLKSLFNMDHMTLAYPSFSPDGNWYIIGCIDGSIPQYEPQSPYFVAIPVTPVDKEHSYFLDIDNLVVLGQVPGMTSIAWTSEPTSYVVSNGELLHKWDLDELPKARVFVVPGDDEEQKTVSIPRKIARLFGFGRQK
jgi:hypothetical protein